MVEWQNGGMAEWLNGRMAEWYFTTYLIYPAIFMVHADNADDADGIVFYYIPNLSCYIYGTL
jgi:hypothetical protein